MLPVGAETVDRRRLFYDGGTEGVVRETLIRRWRGCRKGDRADARKLQLNDLERQRKLVTVKETKEKRKLVTVKEIKEKKKLVTVK